VLSVVEGMEVPGKMRLENQWKLGDTVMQDFDIRKKLEDCHKSNPFLINKRNTTILTEDNNININHSNTN